MEKDRIPFQINVSKPEWKKLFSEKSMIVENVEGISLRNVNLSKDID